MRSIVGYSIASLKPAALVRGRSCERAHSDFSKKSGKYKSFKITRAKKKTKTKALYVQKPFEEKKHQKQDQEQKQKLKKYVRTARTREEANDRILTYLKTQFRSDLKAAGPDAWRDFALQLWSALHPDPAAKVTRSIADIRRYTRALLARIDAGAFFPRPQLAQMRCDRARKDRRSKSAARCNEARRLTEITAAMARGESAQRRASGSRDNPVTLMRTSFELLKRNFACEIANNRQDDLLVSNAGVSYGLRRRGVPEQQILS